MGAHPVGVGIHLVHVLAVPHEKAVAAQRALRNTEGGWVGVGWVGGLGGGGAGRGAGLGERGARAQRPTLLTGTPSTHPPTHAGTPRALTCSDSQLLQHVRLPSVFWRHWWQVEPRTLS